jgi:hypothetical protein
VVTLTLAHDAVLAPLAWLPGGANADATLVAQLLCVPEAEASRLLNELEGRGMPHERDGAAAVATPPWQSPSNCHARLRPGSPTGNAGGARSRPAHKRRAANRKFGEPVFSESVVSAIQETGKTRTTLNPMTKPRPPGLP